MMMRRVVQNTFGILRRGVHDSAQKGFTAAGAETYEQGRPEYSEDALQEIFRVLKKSGPPQETASPASYKVIELGAGTGKFTSSFQRHVGSLSNGKVDYTATEPSLGFLSALQAKGLPGIAVKQGSADKIPSETGQTHMIVVAQAFHWMDNQKTLDEVHRALLPGGSLVLIWNSYDYSDADWLRQIDNQILVPAYGDHTPRQQTENWRSCFLSDKARQQYTSVHAWYQPYLHTGDRGLVENRVFSTSVVAQKPQREQDQDRVIMNRILDTHPQLEEARRTGVFSVPYQTHVAWVYKK